MERLSGLQQRLLSDKSSRPFVHSQLVEWLVQFYHLFSIDEEKLVAKFTRTPAELRTVLDKLLLIAGHYGINMERAVWGKYPKICPYCLRKPCSCGPQKPKPHKHLDVPLPKEGLTLGDIQTMFKEIYPKPNSLLQQSLDVVEEATETSLEIFHSGAPQKVAEEFADLFARFIRVANAIGISLEGIVP